MIIPVNKPRGWTSFDVVRKVRAITGEKRVGHAGTLDPFAEGVLVVGVGRSSTRQLRHIVQGEKEYVADLRLGVETDTLDPEGRVVARREVPPLSEQEIVSIFAQFTGEITQIPPMYSAKRVNGTRLYKLARQNVVIERKPIVVEIVKLRLISFSGNMIRFAVTCSKGTYVRQLASDIAKELGTVGHLVSLNRTRVGNYSLDKCRTIQELEEEWLSIVE